jgi:hypothetical protein
MSEKIKKHLAKLATERTILLVRKCAIEGELAEIDEELEDNKKQQTALSAGIQLCDKLEPKKE